MSAARCYMTSCDLLIEYACYCTSPPTYSCSSHWASHCRLTGRSHRFDSFFLPHFEETKAALLKFLTKEKSKKDRLKKKAIKAFNNSLSNSEIQFRKFVKTLDSDSTKIDDYFEKISISERTWNLEQDPFLNLLTLDPNDTMKKAKTIVQTSTDSYENEELLWGLSKEIEKWIECYINDRFKIFLDRLSELEKIVSKLNKNDQLDEVAKYIFDLIRNVKKSKEELEDKKQDLKKNYQSHSQKRAPEILNPNPTGTQIQARSKSIIQELIKKKSEILNKINDPWTEQDFRKTCALYEHDKNLTGSNSQFFKAYQEYKRAYNQTSSIYLTRDNSKTTSLFVYNTETEKEENRLLHFPNSLNSGTCIAQIPNGELFCFGKADPVSGTALIIDGDYNVRMLPSWLSCSNSSAIYFNRNIYCFGGFNENDLTLSGRFDLEKNRWTQLQALPEPDSCCHTLIFNGDILISGYRSAHLLKYSISSSSFTEIRKTFAACKNKILMNLDRLYLIECGGLIYESEIGNETIWKQITYSIIDYDNPLQVYCSYNKGSIYIGSNYNGQHYYYKFDLSQKEMIKIQ
ncbi:unnamed protein product [Blepharisma stoltei]|uniref:Kelch motif family protein n=1 Tax=Blepharisma stoltei TaxID=1481888 RepID=A0AAU9JY49_9CILI|nr:unnamed protein product [Blepharisma stoltei]